MIKIEIDEVEFEQKITIFRDELINKLLMDSHFFEDEKEYLADLLIYIQQEIACLLELTEK